MTTNFITRKVRPAKHDGASGPNGYGMVFKLTHTRSGWALTSLCYLLGLCSAAELEPFPFLEALFEAFVAAEMLPSVSCKAITEHQ